MTTTAAALVKTAFKLERGPWRTLDPFLFCVFHNDAYPNGFRGTLGPDPRTTSTRDIGSDFSYQEGWSMYHGEIVPGFPQHPHRGFETITVTQKGLVDHSDSMGATARYGEGDVQWMTAGSGIQHAEMFPLVNDDKPNPLELYQIWLNLPRRSKMVKPHFGMFWAPDVPKVRSLPGAGESADAASLGTVRIIAGSYNGAAAPAPPPDSYASQPEAEIVVFELLLTPGQHVVLPPASNERVNRTIYCVRLEGGAVPVNISRAGDASTVSSLRALTGATVDSTATLDVALPAGGGGFATLLVLQGRPIGEPVVQHGPFVMNTQEEIMQAFADYRKTSFGRWPWPTPDHTHAQRAGRFAIHADGHREEPRPAVAAAAPSVDDAVAAA